MGHRIWQMWLVSLVSLIYVYRMSVCKMCMIYNVELH